MRSRTISFIAACAVLSWMACDTGSSSRGDEAGNRDGDVSIQNGDTGFNATDTSTGVDVTSRPDVQTGIDTRPGPDPSGGLACLFDDQRGTECESCLSTSCGTELENAFGTRGIPTVAGGACAGFLSCVDQCDCDDDGCLETCATTTFDAGCQQALQAVEACSGECDEVCDGDEPEPATCGDAVLDSGEECDDALPVTNTCADLGFDSDAPVRCLGCEFDTSDCENVTAEDVCDPDGEVGVNTELSSALERGVSRTGGPRGELFHSWALFLDAGQTVTILMQADFDTYLYLLNEECDEVQSDDDGGGGTNSQLVFTAEVSGTYTVVATSFSGGDGDYNLTIADGTP